MAVPTLITILGNEDEYCGLRDSAAEALGEIRDAKAVPALIIALQQDEDVDVRYSAALALQKMDETAVPDIMVALQGKNSYVSRRSAAEALGKISPKIEDLQVLNQIRNAILWYNPPWGFTPAPSYYQIAQRLTELTVRELPLNDPLRSSPRYTPPPWLKWGGGVVVVVLTAVTLVLTNTAIDLLSNQLGAYLPANSVVLVVAAAVVLVFLVAFSRWLEK